MKPYHYYFKVKRVIDGDTVVLIIDQGMYQYSVQSIRLAGINAPEVRTRDKAEKLRGVLAKEWLQQRLTNTEGMILHTERVTGKYGRFIGTIFDAEGNSINDDMVSAGHAVRYEA